MRRHSIHILLLCLGFCLPSHAQNPAKGVSFDAAVGAGYSTLGYKTVSTETLGAYATGSWGMHGHVGVNYFFVDWMGFGIGADFTRYGGGMTLDGTMQWAGVTDTDGERYDHTLAIDGWREEQQELYLAPQFFIHAAIPVRRVRLLISVGAEYAFCLSSSYVGRGSLTHTGYYPWGNLTLHDLDKYGFYTTSTFRPSATNTEVNVQQLSLVGKIGVAIPLKKNLDLTVNLLAKYSVWSSQTREAGGGSAVGFYENRTALSDGDPDPHYFIPEYAPLTTTPLTEGKFAPLYVGLEVGIRFTIPQRKCWPCMLEGD